MTGRLTDRAAWVVLHAYRGASVRTRVHTAVRHLSAPFAAIEAALPPVGEILDYGCGHGVLGAYLTVTRADRQVHGVDVDTDKLSDATVAARQLGIADRIAFEGVKPGWLPPERRYDAVVCVDVLYLLGISGALGTLDSLAASLRPGGVLLVKEMDETPRWKRILVERQERLATGPLGLTQGAALVLVPRDLITGRLAAAGLDVDVVKMDRRHLHPHVGVVGRRPR